MSLPMRGILLGMVLTTGKQQSVTWGYRSMHPATNIQPPDLSINSEATGGTVDCMLVVEKQSL